jgi:hypothetical protein
MYADEDSNLANISWLDKSIASMTLVYQMDLLRIAILIPAVRIMATPLNVDRHDALCISCFFSRAHYRRVRAS